MDLKISQKIYELYEMGHDEKYINEVMRNLNMKKNISDNLLPYQTLHTFNMITAVKHNTVSFDGSYTGTGKTYTTIATCAHLDMKPFIICPINIISKWIEVLKLFGIDYVTVVNYEILRNCNMYDKKGNVIECPYITKNNNRYVWNFKNNKNIVLIFDEVHKCKNHKTLNGQLLLSCRHMKTIMLSATLCDKTVDFGIFGMMLGFYKNHRQGKNWINSIIRDSKNQYMSKHVNILHKYLYPDKGSHMTLDDLGDAFPMNQVSIDCYKLNDKYNTQINEYYNNIKTFNNNEGENKLEQITFMRQKIENIKAIIMIEIMMEYYEKNRSVVLFVNYISTHNIITKYLDNSKISYERIIGNQTIEERQLAIDRFQNNEIRIMVCMIQAGSTSVSLHDLTGRFPRVSIISPSYSNIELAQTLGRIYRVGVKSPCLQKIIYCAHTCEEEIAEILKKKKDFMKNITDKQVSV